MAADPGRAVLEGIEALGVPELHVFLLRLGIDGRGLDPDRSPRIPARTDDYNRLVVAMCADRSRRSGVSAQRITTGSSLNQPNY